MGSERFAVECVNINKSFGDKNVLHDINLRVKPGTIMALVGPNGAGKTTLLKILATLIAPSGGRAFIGGENVADNPIDIKKKMGFLSSEERSFYWRLTGRQNLKFFASLYDIRGKDKNKRIDEVLTSVGFYNDADTRFREYSTGMKQTLGIVRVLLHDPSVLLLDEPTRSLSPDVAKRIRKLILKKAKDEGKTVLISSHNLSEVEKLADSIAMLDHGVIQSVGTMDELKKLAGISVSANLNAVFEYFTGKDGGR